MFGCAIKQIIFITQYFLLLGKLLTNQISDEAKYEYFDDSQMYRTAYKDRLVKASYAGLCKEFKDNKHYQALGGQSAQQCIKLVVEGITSYNKQIKV